MEKFSPKFGSKSESKKERRRPKVYISGALTGVSDPDSLKKFYEDIGKLCREFDMMPYIPHQHTDPERHSKVTPKKVYNKDKKQIWKSNLVIAYVGVSSLGVGSELAIAEVSDVPIILIYEKGKQISRMARGNTAVIHKVRCTNFDEALNRLREILKKEFFRIHFAKEFQGKGPPQRYLAPTTKKR